MAASGESKRGVVAGAQTWSIGTVLAVPGVPAKAQGTVVVVDVVDEVVAAAPDPCDAGAERLEELVAAFPHAAARRSNVTENTPRIDCRERDFGAGVFIALTSCASPSA
jgi:hypothetical protein